MSEEVKNVITDEQIAEAVKRVGELAKTRQEINTYKSELLTHQEDLENAKKVFGVGSSEYELQKGHVDNKTSLIEEAEKKVAELSYKRSELKPILDALAKKFEEAYKADTSKEYHIEVYPKPEKKDEPIDPNKGKKVFRQLMDYLYHNVGFNAKSAASLMVLVLNMEENKPWVNSKAFDNHIILRSASVLSLGHSLSAGRTVVSLFPRPCARFRRTMRRPVRLVPTSMLSRMSSTSVRMIFLKMKDRFQHRKR